MTTTAFAPAVTGFGFQRRMAQADSGAFRRWYDACCLLVPTAAERAATFSSPAGEPAAAMAEAA